MALTVGITEEGSTHCDLLPDTPALPERFDEPEAPRPLVRKKPAMAGDVDEAAA